MRVGRRPSRRVIRAYNTHQFAEEIMILGRQHMNYSYYQVVNLRQDYRAEAERHYQYCINNSKERQAELETSKPKPCLQPKKVTNFNKAHQDQTLDFVQNGKKR